nr:conserved hypothetical plastid protein [Bangiopsis subsimplex]
MKMYYILASKQFLLQEEPVEEILRERLNYYKDNNLSIDFWLVQNLNLLQTPELLQSAYNLVKDPAIIISTNIHFIDWLKLRLQYVKTGSLNSVDPSILKELNSK